VCSEGGAVADIHFWFSARQDWFEIEQDWRAQIDSIHVSIHENIPGPPYSRPGATLWEAGFEPDSLRVRIREYGEGDQAWYDPETGEYIPSDHVKIYQCNIMGIRNPFIQVEDSVYWLDISVSSIGPLGWKTADRDRYPIPYTGRAFMDDAVWGSLPAPSWDELIYPPEAYPDSGSIDLAFVITADTTTADFPDDPETAPVHYRLGKTYPNPFDLNTIIRYDSPKTGRVLISVFNVRGRRVRVLVDGEVPPGRHTAVWDGRNDSGQPVASGIYFLQMKARGFSGSKKLVLLK
jgi:hypothetical protein